MGDGRLVLGRALYPRLRTGASALVNILSSMSDNLCAVHAVCGLRTVLVRNLSATHMVVQRGTAFVREVRMQTKI